MKIDGVDKNGGTLQLPKRSELASVVNSTKGARDKSRPMR